MTTSLTNCLLSGNSRQNGTNNASYTTFVRANTVSKTISLSGDSSQAGNSNDFKVDIYRHFKVVIESFASKSSGYSRLTSDEHIINDSPMNKK